MAPPSASSKGRATSAARTCSRCHIGHRAIGRGAVTGATGIANDCREPIAERVVNKERANFCGYHKPKPGAFNAAGGAATAARAALDSLFGGAGVVSPAAEPSQAALEALFRKHD